MLLFKSPRQRITILLLHFVLLAVYSTSLLAQNVQKTERLFLPNEEEFQEATDLVASWRSTGFFITQDYDGEFNEIPGREFVKKHILSIYNEDGSLWYRFSVAVGNPAWFVDNRHKDFLPFSTNVGFIRLDKSPDLRRMPPGGVILRMVGESATWYKVEVNEFTKEIKYILKSDAAWTKTSWKYWLFKGYNVFVNPQSNKIFDAPNGNEIEVDFTKFADFEDTPESKKFRVKKVEGDWMQIGFIRPDIIAGWVKWREGRNILVNCFFSERKIPKMP